MFQFILIFLSIFMSFIFMNMKHPLAMGMILLIQTFIISLISGMLSKTFWFSYTLFLIFLGGMLILFIYMTSLASNEMFSLSMKMTTIMITMMMMTGFIMIFIDPTLINSYIMNMEMNTNYNLLNFMKEDSLNLNKLYNFPTNIITLMLINYLLLTLIIVVKITNNFYGPLRNN